MAKKKYIKLASSINLDMYSVIWSPLISYRKDTYKKASSNKKDRSREDEPGKKEPSYSTLERNSGQQEQQGLV